MIHLLAAAGDYPSDDVATFVNVAAALLAVSVGVYAFVPLIVELALMRTSDADHGVRRARRADAAFDLLIVSVGLFGISLLMGVLATYVEVLALHVIQVVVLVGAVVLLLAGTLWLGYILRDIRRSG